MTTPTLALKREARFKYSPGLHCGLHVYHFEADFSAALPQSLMSCKFEVMTQLLRGKEEDVFFVIQIVNYGGRK